MIKFRYVSKRQHDSEIFLTALQNLAICNHICGNKNEAIKSSNECIRYKIAKFGNKHLTVANAFANSANIYFKAGFIKKAEHQYLEALEIYKKKLTSCHPNVL
jgi:tetratricopeptide (TPR) repeat protein